jgi:hypothetical protein
MFYTLRGDDSGTSQPTNEQAGRLRGDFERAAAVGQARPSTRHHERNADVPPLRRDIELIDVHALQEENTQLRALVIQLSKLVIKNVVDHK